MSKRPHLVLIHGFLGSSEDWAEVARGYFQNFDCHFYTVPGHRFKPVDRSKPLLEIVLSELDSLITELKKKGPVFMAGYSLGGRIALQYSARFHGKVIKLAILSANPGSFQTSCNNYASQVALWQKQLRTLPFKTFIQTWYKSPLFKRLTLDKTLLKRRLKNCPEDLAYVVKELSIDRCPNLWNQPPSFFKNCLFFFGKEDIKYGQVAKKLLQEKSAATICVDGASHALLQENPGACGLPIYQFLMEDKNHMSLACDETKQHWEKAARFEEILYHKRPGCAKITINRPHVHNAFTPQTVSEMIKAMEMAKADPDVGVIFLTGAGKKAFCSGGDQNVRGHKGYKDTDGTEHLNVLELQKLIRSIPKVVIALVNGYAIGGGHVLHVVCDLTIASENAIFGQVGPKVGSFDGGLGASYLASHVGQKKAKEIWFLCDQYSAIEAEKMGMVNKVVPIELLEETGLRWAHKILSHSKLAIRCLKSAFHADCDGQLGLLELAGNATMLYYMSDEAKEGSRAFLEKRKPNFEQFK